MKVCTDSCLFGAWIKEPEATNFLDIGTGTGLLALMIAQNHKAEIDAVEIDEISYKQAKENVSLSPWKDKITVHHADVLDFQQNHQECFDVIVCNPPFFKNHLRSSDDKRNKVLHDDLLKFDDIIRCVNKMLRKDGRFYIMLPVWEAVDFEKQAKKEKLFPTQILLIKEKVNREYIRRFTSYSKTDSLLLEEELIIRNEDNAYSSSFSSLLKDYYLHL